jgi:glycosyltransferase involved in cell wall biosynthesis
MSSVTSSTPTRTRSTPGPERSGMKILMLAPEPFFQPRGTPISVYFRIKALADLGHATTLVTYPVGEDVAFPNLVIRRSPNPVRIRKVKIGPSLVKLPLDALLSFTALRQVLRDRPDLIFSHEEAGWVGAALGKLFRIPHLYDMHSSLPQQLENFRFSKSRLLKSVFLALERFVLKSSRCVIVICRDLFDYVAKLGFKDKAVFLENFIDFNDFEPAPAAAAEIASKRAEISPAGKSIILYAGNFEPYQGIPLLVDAFAKVTSPSVLLIVGGVRSEHDAMRARAAALGAADRIVFVEKVPPNEVPVYIALADVLVSPRVSGTNTPLKIYSFLKSGKPLVATDLWTHTQVVDERIAVLAPPDSAGLAAALTFALESEEARERGSAAKRMADENYTYPKYKEKMCEALSRTVP